MRHDKLVAVVARRAGPILRGLVERVHDAQGLWVCERAELLAQGVSVLETAYGSVRGVRECIVEHLLKRCDARAATYQRDVLEFVLCIRFSG